MNHAHKRCGIEAVEADRYDAARMRIGHRPSEHGEEAHALTQVGTARAGITLTTDDNVTATTDATGIAVLAPVTMFRVYCVWPGVSATYSVRPARSRVMPSWVV